jgi:hypothetical protein
MSLLPSWFVAASGPEMPREAAERWPAGLWAGRNPTTNKTEKVNLLSERLQEKAEIPARPDAPGLPVASLVFDALESAYRTFQGQGLFERAIQAQATRPR